MLAMHRLKLLVAWLSVNIGVIHGGGNDFDVADTNQTLGYAQALAKFPNPNLSLSLTPHSPNPNLNLTPTAGSLLCQGSGRVGLWRGLPGSAVASQRDCG